MSNQPPKFIPTPAFIMESATNMTGGTAAAEARSAPQASGDETRNFAPGDAPALPAAQQATIASLGTTPGFHIVDAAGNLGGDPAQLHDVIIASGSAFLGQAVRDEVALVGNSLGGYRSYAGTQSQVEPSISGGAPREAAAMSVQGVNIAYGRWENASLGFFGAGSETRLPGSIRWIMAPSGFPTFLSDVLTGSATYTLAAATAPTNQDNVTGRLGQATLNVNFSNRSLGFEAAVAMPTGNWRLSASDVPISLNTFYSSTAAGLVVTNGAGQSSRSNSNLTGSFEGSFVGTGLGAAIVGYGINDLTAAASSGWQFVTGVAAFSGPRQDAAAAYREGRISDPAGELPDFIRSSRSTTRACITSSPARRAGRWPCLSRARASTT